MNKEFVTDIGYAVLWCTKYVFIPFGIAVSAKIFAEKILQPQPERQKKKRSYKNRFKN